MAKQIPMDDFEAQLTRRDARGWGADVTRNSVAANSDFMLDSERLRTQPVYEPSAKEKREIKKARQGGGNQAYPVAMSGRFVDKPVDVLQGIKRFQGERVYRSAYRAPGEE